MATGRPHSAAARHSIARCNRRAARVGVEAPGMTAGRAVARAGNASERAPRGLSARGPARAQELALSAARRGRPGDRLREGLRGRRRGVRGQRRAGARAEHGRRAVGRLPRRAGAARRRRAPTRCGPGRARSTRGCPRAPRPAACGCATPTGRPRKPSLATVRIVDAPSPPEPVAEPGAPDRDTTDAIDAPRRALHGVLRGRARRDAQLRRHRAGARGGRGRAGPARRRAGRAVDARGRGARAPSSGWTGTARSGAPRRRQGRYEFRVAPVGAVAARRRRAAARSSTRSASSTTSSRSAARTTSAGRARVRRAARGPLAPGPGRLRRVRHAAGRRARRHGRFKAWQAQRRQLRRDPRRRQRGRLRLHAPRRARRSSRRARGCGPGSGSATSATPATRRAATCTSSCGRRRAGTRAARRSIPSPNCARGTRAADGYGPVMAKQTVALYTVTSGDRVERARTSLAEALGGAELAPADDAGAFDVAVDAETPEEAIALVREAFARAGTGDDFVIRETTEGREMPADDPRQGPDVAGAADDGAPAPPTARPASPTPPAGWPPRRAAGRRARRPRARSRPRAAPPTRSARRRPPPARPSRSRASAARRASTRATSATSSAISSRGSPPSAPSCSCC